MAYEPRDTKRLREERDEKIRALSAAGWSVREIAEEVDWSVGTVQKAIRS